MITFVVIKMGGIYFEKGFLEFRTSGIYLLKTQNYRRSQPWYVAIFTVV